MTESEPSVRMTIAESEGGIYEDTALIAGYCLGALDTYLTYADTPFQFVMPRGCIEQADLFAMHHNYASAEVGTNEDETWVVMQFEPLGDFLGVTG